LITLNFTHLQKNKAISVSKVYAQHHLPDLFSLPLSAEAYTQLSAVQSFLQHFPLTTDHDKWDSNWGEFSASKTYKFLIGHRNTHQVYKWLWSCFCQPKHKGFFWLLLKDRLSTRNILRRKHMHLESYNCVLCQLSVKETCEHLFIECPFAKDCWNLLGVTLQNGININDCILQLKEQSHPKFFMMVAILMCWAIWTVRNDLICKNLQPEIQAAKEIFRKELKLLNPRAKARVSLIFDLWIQNLL